MCHANKDLIAEEGKETFDTAQAAGKDFLFEAAVAGGIPIIRPLKQCLAGNDLTDVTRNRERYDELYSDEDV